VLTAVAEPIKSPVNNQQGVRTTKFPTQSIRCTEFPIKMQWLVWKSSLSGFPPSFISLCHHTSPEMNTLVQASTLPLKGVSPYCNRVVMNFDGILVYPELQVHLLRVLTCTQPKMSIMPSKAHWTSILNVLETTQMGRGQVSEGKTIVWLVASQHLLNTSQQAGKVAPLPNQNRGYARL